MKKRCFASKDKQYAEVRKQTERLMRFVMTKQKTAREGREKKHIIRAHRSIRFSHIFGAQFEQN
jgi:hypothetical protein